MIAKFLNKIPPWAQILIAIIALIALEQVGVLIVMGILRATSSLGYIAAHLSVAALCIFVVVVFVFRRETKS